VVFWALFSVSKANEKINFLRRFSKISGWKNRNFWKKKQWLMILGSFNGTKKQKTKLSDGMFPTQTKIVYAYVKIEGQNNADPLF
jgi:hypothetical protein